MKSFFRVLLFLQGRSSLNLDNAATQPTHPGEKFHAPRPEKKPKRQNLDEMRCDVVNGFVNYHTSTRMRVTRQSSKGHNPNDGLHEMGASPLHTPPHTPTPRMRPPEASSCKLSGARMAASSPGQARSICDQLLHLLTNPIIQC